MLVVSMMSLKNINRSFIVMEKQRVCCEVGIISLTVIRMKSTCSWALVIGPLLTPWILPLVAYSMSKNCLPFLLSVFTSS